MRYLKKNNYAIVTGAAGLLGPSHVEALVSIGYNVVLIEEDSLIVHSEDFLKTDVNLFTG